MSKICKTCRTSGFWQRDTGALSADGCSSPEGGILEILLLVSNGFLLVSSFGLFFFLLQALKHISLFFIQTTWETFQSNGVWTGPHFPLHFTQRHVDKLVHKVREISIILRFSRPWKKQHQQIWVEHRESRRSYKCCNKTQTMMTRENIAHFHIVYLCVTYLLILLYTSYWHSKTKYKYLG